jgi:hypothetical protein
LNINAPGFSCCSFEKWIYSIICGSKKSGSWHGFHQKGDGNICLEFQAWEDLSADVFMNVLAAKPSSAPPPPMGQMSSQQAAAWWVGLLQAAQRMQQAKDAMCVQMNR